MNRIFLIDDDTIANLVTKKALQAYYDSPEVEVFRNGLEALNQYLRDEPDLCIIDINMPQISGFQFLDKAKKRGSDKCNLVMLSATVLESDVKKAKDQGALGIISKPLTLDKLKAFLPK